MKPVHEIRVVWLLAALSHALGCGGSTAPVEHAETPDEAPPPRASCEWHRLPLRYLFAARSSELGASSERPNQDELLEELVEYLRRHRAQRIRLIGTASDYCPDERAVAEELGLARARAIADRLVELGVVADLIEARSERRLIAYDTPPTCDTLDENRRVELEVFLCE